MTVSVRIPENVSQAFGVHRPVLDQAWSYLSRFDFLDTQTHDRARTRSPVCLVENFRKQIQVSL